MITPRARAARQIGREHYERLHQTSVKYQQNNWLLDDLAHLAAAGGESIIEVGCGNGLFLERASQHWRRIVGVDWVRSESLDRVLANHPGIGFVQQDITELEVEQRFDLLVSADVLEHLHPSALSAVIRRLHASACRAYHKIACYDDGHSHLAVMRPRRWLQLFEDAVPDGRYRIVDCEYRDRRRTRPVVVISNLTTPDITDASSV
jgi:trans-aconitate methyltransferase